MSIRICLALVFLFLAGHACSQSASRKDSAYALVLIQLAPGTPYLKGADGALDSAKVYNFMARYNHLYGHRIEYQRALLHTIRATRVPSEDNLFVYDSMLMALPGYVLESSEDPLYNKLTLGRALPVDTALDLAQRLHRVSAKGFRTWVQAAFIYDLQDNAPADTAFVARLISNGVSARRARQLNRPLQDGYDRKLLNKMQQDTALADFVYPMALWCRLREQPTNMALQSSTVKAFDKISHEAALHGNAGRYALLCYQLLLHQHSNALADTLMTHTLARLQREATDTLNPDRNASRSLLAHAWYARSRNAKDSSTALSDLAQAAALAPRNTDERSRYGYFDLEMLGDDFKESYRDDFKQALLRQGNDKTALKVLAEQVYLEPDRITELKSLFHERFPDGNFAGFFNAHVLHKWTAAPDFRLRTADGQLRQLSDYRGKWLLVDFWGTWCAPCRAELPALNQYAASIAGDSSQAFLGIDCGDLPGVLPSFMENHHYNMPQVISDRKVERDYQIRSYPTKFLIAPDGRMTPLAFGISWQDAVKQYQVVFTEMQQQPARQPASLKNNKN